MSIKYDSFRLFEPVKQILDRMLGAGALGRKKQSAEVWGIWEDAVGTKIAAHARPLRLRNGVLTVAVDSAAWHHQLQALQEQLLDKLRMHLGRDAVKTLRFRVQNL